MGRSLKKGPFVAPKLLKKIEAMIKDGTISDMSAVAALELCK